MVVHCWNMDCPCQILVKDRIQLSFTLIFGVYLNLYLKRTVKQNRYVLYALCHQCLHKLSKCSFIGPSFGFSEQTREDLTELTSVKQPMSGASHHSRSPAMPLFTTISKGEIRLQSSVSSVEPSLVKSRLFHTCRN